jgi:hypothetical protein
MKIFKHESYKDYVKAQIKKNVKKLNNVWVREEEINIICKKINNTIKNASFGICHGVRNTWEVIQFRQKLGINVIGTDISPTINYFPTGHSIEWDFHKIKNEWIDNVDFIYSNSFDHSYDPTLCLDMWMKCIKKNGLCFIHWMSKKEAMLDTADCFYGTEKEYRKFFNKKYKVLDEIKIKKRTIFVIGHREEVKE